MFPSHLKAVWRQNLSLMETWIFFSFPLKSLSWRRRVISFTQSLLVEMLITSKKKNLKNTFRATFLLAFDQTMGHLRVIQTIWCVKLTSTMALVCEVVGRHLIFSDCVDHWPGSPSPWPQPCSPPWHLLPPGTLYVLRSYLLGPVLNVRLSCPQCPAECLTHNSEAKVKVLVVQSYATLCDPVDCRPAGSSVPGILQTRILEWVAILFSRGSSQPRDRTHISSILLQNPAGRFFTIWATREALPQ